VVPRGLALATSQPWAQHDTGPGYSLCRQFFALAWRAQSPALRPQPADRYRACRARSLVEGQEHPARPNPASDRRPIPKLAAPRRTRMVNLRPAPMLSKTMTEHTDSTGVFPLHDKSELTLLQPPTASRPAHRYARTQRPLVGMSACSRATSRRTDRPCRDNRRALPEPCYQRRAASFCWPWGDLCFVLESTVPTHIQRLTEGGN
jgi:hypothetical protein